MGGVSRAKEAADAVAVSRYEPVHRTATAWQDVHARFMAYAAEMIAEQVEPRYFVKIEIDLFVQELPADARELVRPDLIVGDGDQEQLHIQDARPAIPAPAQVGMPAVIEKRRSRYLDIHDRAGRKVVTVLELLSPGNKQSRSERDQYRAKLQRILASDTNFVEIDLLRGGTRTSWDGLPKCDYYAVVSRPEDRAKDPPRADLWPIGLREPLSPIPIPLRPGEPDPKLDLQAIVHRIYDTAGYRPFIYDADPEPPLSAADAVWAAQILNPPAPTGPTSAPAP